ncbi:MAG: hypothetical protein ACI9JN_001339 [Bacteroidia bacterium]|jgi:hypothetical protein
MKKLFNPYTKSFLLILTLFLFGCSTTKVFYGANDKNWEETAPVSENKLSYSLYLLGDAGADTFKSKAVLNYIAEHLKSADSNKSGVVFLGDNIYPLGLHKKHSKYRSEDELRLNAQLDAVKDFNGEIVFVPGNHDWKQGKPNGLKYIKRQEKYIKKYLDKDNVFLPENGCPGPTEVQLAPGLLMIVIDTQWWLHQFEKSSGEKDDCDVGSTEELKKAFNDMLKKYRGQNIIVVGHHPLYSNGNHGGNFELKDHIFPFTASKHKKAYFPLPVVGSIYPSIRKYIGLHQDLTSPTYRNMKRDMEEVMNGYDNIVYIAGHEHNLQYVHNKSIHQVVSGSGSKVTHLKFNNDIDFGAEEKGYSKISYYENGEIWLEFAVIDDSTISERIVFRKLLYTKRVVHKIVQANSEKTSYAGMFKTISPDSLKSAKGFKTKILGELNRGLWAAPVTVPYLDIHFEKGGMTPIKKGGGMQTLSLRMLGGDGNQYTLRGIKKSPEFIIAKSLRGTLAQDIIYDGFAASHPYASVVVPYLSEAVNIYYSDSKLVYVPKDSVLGDYLEEFGGMFCLLEQRPDRDVSDQSNFGNSEDVMSVSKMLEKIHSKTNHKIDKDFTVRTRIFDMLIGDFDRHDDQWRWAKIKKDDFVFYRPIPRDRDQAFFKIDGLAMNMSSWKWLLRYTQNFYGGAEDVLGLNLKALHFDRSFLTEATLKDWVTQAKYIQSHLSDEEIVAAVNQFPPEAFEVRGEEIIESLKIRRDQLVQYVEGYYAVLAKSVDIVGTYESDYVLIERKKSGNVEVSVYPRKHGKRDKSEKYYHRVFKRGTTKEIRLYGLDGDDEYHITGEVDKSILVRIIAGDGKDKVVDESSVKGPKKMTRVYDLKGKSKIDEGKDTKLTVMAPEDMYDYDRLAFKYNKSSPALSLGFNPNDGFFIGPGFVQTIYGFEKSPYKFQHKFMANYTFGTNGFNVAYDYDLVDAIGKGDLGGKLTVNSPLAFSYFGADNDPSNDLISEYNVLMNNYKFEPTLTYSSKDEAHNLVYGLHYNYVNFDTKSITTVQNWELESQHFAGGKLEYQFLNKDHELNPHNGMEFKLGGHYIRSVSNNNVDFIKLHSALSLFLPIKFIRNQTTLALRSGVESNIGDYAFFQSTFLSGYDNFRGVRRNRYAGKTSHYNNVEIRMNLFKVPNYIIPFEVGILGHYDAARIWTTDVSDWQTSFGGGAFINATNMFMLFGTYSVSENTALFVFGSKFLF